MLFWQHLGWINPEMGLGPNGVKHGWHNQLFTNFLQQMVTKSFLHADAVFDLLVPSR